MGAFKCSFKVNSELQAPAANRLVGDYHTAFGQKVFDVAEAQAEATVDPDGIAGDFGGKPMAMVTGFALIHRISVPEGALIKWYSTGKTAFNTDVDIFAYLLSTR